MTKNEYLPKELIKEAEKNPGGYVYKIDDKYRNSEDIPPEAIVGAWKVDNEGLIIIDSYISNPNYRS